MLSSFFYIELTVEEERMTSGENLVGIKIDSLQWRYLVLLFGQIFGRGNLFRFCIGEGV